ncbi:MAG: hypothetical protein ACOY93_02070 [Bacillota bacterium]
MFYAGYPATKATGFAKAVPTFTKAVAPYGGVFGKPFGKGVGFGKPFGKGVGFGKPFGKGVGFGKPFGKGVGFGKPFGAVGYPATKAAGYSAAVPVTSVATSPVPGII